MLFSFSKGLLVLSVLAGVLYYLMTYPMVFEKVRKYLPFKFNNTKIMLIFNSVVFSLVMYFMGFILLKSLHLEGFKIPERTPTPTPGSYPRITGLWVGPGIEEDVTIEISLATQNPPTYNMVVTRGDAGWKNGKLQCSKMHEPLGCGNRINYKVYASLSNGNEQNGDTKYWNGGSGTVSNSTIEWNNDTVWTKQEQNTGKMWLPKPEVLSNRWFFKKGGCELKRVNNPGDGFSSESECDEWFKKMTGQGV